MSFFNPKIYNKQNLKEDDLSELEYWHGVFTSVIDNAEFDAYADTECCKVFRDARNEIIKDFCHELKTKLGYTMQDNVVGIIDNYDDDVQEREEFETFIYEEEE